MNEEQGRKHLPEAFMVEGERLATQFTIFGIRVHELTREELIAALGHYVNFDRRNHEQHSVKSFKVRSLFK